MKTSKFYLGSQALLILHCQYFPMQSNQLRMCPDQKCKRASFRSMYFRYLPVSAPFSWPFQSLLEFSTGIIYKEEKI